MALYLAIDGTTKSNFFTPGLTVGTLQGLLKSDSGVVATAGLAGPLSFDGTTLTCTALTNPMTGAGELIYGGVGGALTALPAGANTQLLVGGSTPVWTTATGTGAPVRAGSPNFTAGALFDGGAGIDHGVTVYGALTSSYLGIKPYGTDGGAIIQGYSDAAGVPGLYLQGILGVADPTDTVAALYLVGSKKNGTTTQALGAAETVLLVRNLGTDLITVLGNGVTTFSNTIKTTGSAEGLRVIGTGTAGVATTSYVTFYQANGTQRVGFVGKGDTETNCVSLYSDLGNIYLGPNYVGIGTAIPSRQLVVSNGGAVGFEVAANITAGTVDIISYNRATSAYSFLAFVASGYTFGTGTVGINASNTNSPLTVGGSVRYGIDQISKLGFYRYNTADNGAVHYVHLKTNHVCAAGYYNMMTVSYRGYEFAGPYNINTAYSWYSSNGSIISATAYGSHSASAYKSSDGYVVLTIRAVTDVYYMGFVMDCFGPGPQGFFDLLITAATHSDSATRVY